MFVCLLIVGGAVLLSGCLPPAPTVAPAAPSPTFVPSPVPTRPPITPVSGAITLTVWLPDAFTAGAAQPVSNTLLQQLNVFADSRPDTFVAARFKKASGSGGLLDLLRAASPVAPAALPDVAVLSLTDMQTAARLGVLQPLDVWLAAGVVEEMFPFAAAAGQVDGKWYGLPYAVDVEHLAYDTGRFTVTLPLTWTGILSQEAPYLFPLGGAGSVVPDDVLVQYAANGGTLTDARGQPMLDEAPLADTLRQFWEAYQDGLIPPEALRLASLDEVWPIFASRKVSLANVRASQYLAAQDSMAWLGYTALPARSGPARSIARGWAWALVTRDPARQPRAAALLMWMLAADNNAAAAQSIGLLPTRPGALERWGRNDAYAAFLRQELGRAVAPPPANVTAIVGPIFQRALSDVLAGKATPDEAAAAAIAQLKSPSP